MVKHLIHEMKLNSHITQLWWSRVEARGRLKQNIHPLAGICLLIAGLREKWECPKKKIRISYQITWQPLHHILPAWLAQSVACLSLHLGVCRFHSQVSHTHSLVSVTGDSDFIWDFGKLPFPSHLGKQRFWENNYTKLGKYTGNGACIRPQKCPNKFTG